MTTVSDMVKMSLKDIGILDETETPSASLMSDSITTLNQMLAQWQTMKNYIYGQVDVTFSPNGAETYSIGTGQTINVAAPARIDYAFYRLNNVDYPIEILNAFEEYQLGIGYKPITTFPSCLYYNNGSSNGTIYIFPRPTTGVIHLGLAAALPIYSIGADSITLPAEYELAIRYSLSELLSTMLGIVLRPDIAAQALKSRRIIKRMNVRINELDTGICRNTRSGGYPAILRG